MTLIDFRKYPFLKPLEEELKRYAGGVTLNDLLSNAYYLEQAKNRIDKILKEEDLEPYEKLKDPVLVFYTTLYLVSALGNETLKRKFLRKETVLIEKDLRNDNEETLIEISEILGVKVKRENIQIKHREDKRTLIIPLNFSMDFISYLKLTKEIRKDYNNFSLPTKILKDGKVYLGKEEISKIITYKIKDVLYEMMNVSDISIPEAIRKFAEVLKGRKTPPCIINLIKKDEISDEELSILITYFIDIGDEKSIERFSKGKDLERKLRGDKKTKYIIYSCQKMKELGLCVSSCNVINPLQLYYGKLE